jgi:hypothetical protein
VRSGIGCQSCVSMIQQVYLVLALSGTLGGQRGTPLAGKPRANCRHSIVIESIAIANRPLFQVDGRAICVQGDTAV